MRGPLEKQQKTLKENTSKCGDSFCYPGKNLPGRDPTLERTSPP